MIDYDYWDTEDGYACPDCLNDLDHEYCDYCDDGYSYHDCGDDTCCCLHPVPNVICSVCEGHGGWWRCFNGCGCWTLTELEEAWEEKEEDAP